jgi:hypothetical protein
LTGFEYSEDEVDPHLLDEQAPHFNLEALVFLSADQIREFCVYDGADGLRQGRPKGIKDGGTPASKKKRLARLYKETYRSG